VPQLDPEPAPLNIAGAGVTGLKWKIIGQIVSEGSRVAVTLVLVALQYLFFERTRNLLDVVSHEWPAGVRRSIAELDLTYYLPCAARGRTIGYLGVSRTETGDFLSSDDVELLVLFLAERDPRSRLILLYF